MRRISQRVSAIAESATLAVDAKAKALKAAGRPVIGFGAGEPDFPTPEHIVEAAVAACREPWTHKYTPAGGLPRLRAAIARPTGREPGQVIVTNGGKQAVYQAFLTLLDPGDEVLLPAPYWTTYPEAIRLADGVPVPVLADESTGYLVTVEQLAAARTERTKVLLMCSPSNPTGAVYSRDQLVEIGRWAAANDLFVVSDEIYEHLVYGDAQFHSLPVVVPELAERTIVVSGVSKTFAMTGWRVGWMYGPDDLIKGALNLQSHTTSNVSNVAQAAALAALEGGLGHGRADAGGVRPPAADDRADAQRDSRCGLPAAGTARSMCTRRCAACSAGSCADGARRPPPSSRSWSWRRPRSRWCRARRSVRPAISGSPTPSATTTWPKASPAWPSC